MPIKSERQRFGAFCKLEVGGKGKANSQEFNLSLLSLDLPDLYDPCLGPSFAIQLIMIIITIFIAFRAYFC